MPVSWLTIAMTQAACVSSMPSRTTAVGAAGTGAGAGAAAGAEALPRDRADRTGNNDDDAPKHREHEKNDKEAGNRDHERV